MILRMAVHNWRGFHHFEWAPTPCHLLTGPNGGGKSLLLKCLFDLAGIAAFRADPKLLSCESSLGGESWDQRFELDLRAVNGDVFSYGLTLRCLPDEAGVLCCKESLHLGGEPVAQVEMGVLMHRGRAVRQLPNNRSALTLMTEILEVDRFVEALKQVHLTSSGWTSFPWLVARDPERLAPDLSRFAMWLAELGPRREVLVARAAQYFNVDLDELLRGRDIEPAVFDGLSSGELRLWGHRLLGCLMEPGSVLLLDGPCESVAVDRIPGLLRGLRKRAEETGAQLVLATQHPTVIDAFEPMAAECLSVHDGHRVLLPAGKLFTAAEAVAV